MLAVLQHKREHPTPSASITSIQLTTTTYFVWEILSLGIDT
jgi:hypothetical protein